MYIYGKNVAKEKLDSNEKINKVFLSDKFKDYEIIKLLKDKKVKLELDVQERDKYGRILAYVYIDGEMYNKELLKIGYAKIATYPPNIKYVDDFTEIQKQARKNKVGLWS